MNIPGRMERLPVTWFTWKVIFLAGFAWFIESLSIGSLGVVLISLKKVMDLSPSAIGILTAASTFGIVIGLIPAGYFSDRYGRKKVLIWGIVEYSVCTLMCAFSPNFQFLLAFRFLSGLGMGAVFPLPYAIVSEFVNSRKRTFFNGIMDACLSIGYFIAPLLGLVILPHVPVTLSWRIFFAVASLPIFYAYIIHLGLPESPRWLELQGRYEEANDIMLNIEHHVENLIGRRLPEPNPEVVTTNQGKKRNGQSKVKNLNLPKVSMSTPWKKPFLQRTLSRAVAATGTFFMFYIVMTYMPTLFTSQGLSFAHSLLFTAIITGAAIPGKLLNGYLAEHFGRKPVFVGFMGVAGVAALLFGVATTPAGMVFYACIMSFFGTGAFPALKMSYAEQYPTSIRTTGSASVETIGRFLGGVVGSYAMPVILNVKGVSTGFYIVAIVTAVTLVVELLYSPETMDATLEQLESNAVNQRA
jgi:MFS transporter, putative metabolite:H+ symporter